jgi:UDP-N-acetylmuramate--alanine ligase
MTTTPLIPMAFFHGRPQVSLRHVVRRVHFVGIGGSGMSGIAEVLALRGYRVSGSDTASSSVTERLQSLGIRIALGHAASHVDDVDALVVSSAIQPDNPELLAARARQLPIVPRAQMLAELMRFQHGIAIAGTHGKTTTTSLVAAILVAAGLDPTCVIGGRLNSLGTNARLGHGEHIVAEADESDASFLLLTPVIAVITNIDADHMETYGHDFDRLTQAFIDFANRLPFYGLAVLCQDDPVIRAAMPKMARRILTYGLDDSATVTARDVATDGDGMRFVAVSKDTRDADLPIRLNLPGRHNVQNALAAIAIAREVGASDEAIATALARFTGVGRRFQRYGERRVDGRRFALVDDYGHHPAEIEATLAAARGAFPGRRLVLAFQPHRYTRTRDLQDAFAKTLATADALVLTDIYAAGEAPIPGVSGLQLAAAIQAMAHEAPTFVPKVEQIVPALLQMVQDQDVILTMGAGSIANVADGLIRASEGA